MAQPPPNPNQGLYTGFPSVPFLRLQNCAASRAEQPIADHPTVGMCPEGATFPLWPNLDFLVWLDTRTPCSGMMLRLAPWFHPIAERDESLIPSYTDNLETPAKDLPGVVTL